MANECPWSLDVESRCPEHGVPLMECPIEPTVTLRDALAVLN